MKKPVLSKKKYLTLAVVCIVALIAGLVACTPDAGTGTASSGSGTTDPAPVVMPTPDSYGVVHADQWEEAYPNQVATYNANSSNSPSSTKHDYLEMYPALATLYAGMPFSKGYDEASSHLYSLDSVRATPRVGEATLLNCYTCKTPQLTASVNNIGESEYTKPFTEGASFDEPISCYNCHENDPESVTPGNQFFIRAIGNDSSKVPVEAQACGQCHNEYYFNGETKVPTLPYSGLAAMAPQEILAYYDEMGYSDWKYPVTETPMIKVQHPEFETIYGGTDSQGNMANLGYACSDCHMGAAVAEDGTEYTSHEWKSPLENQELLDSTCNTCHGDLAATVKEWQTASEERVQAISQKIADLATKMTEQVNNGTLTGDALAQLQTLHRTSQFYWDFVMVENSEGAHNPNYQNEILDLAEEAVDEGLALLG